MCPTPIRPRLILPKGNQVPEAETGRNLASFGLFSCCTVPFYARTDGLSADYNDSSAPGTVWIWAYSGPDGLIAFSADGEPWRLYGSEGNLSFQLLGVPRTVPEPATTVLAGLALMAAGARRVRRLD